MSSDLDISIRDRVQIIRFTRPDKKNALKSTMYAAISEALATGDASSDVSCHLFIGSGGIFSAGSDINEFITRAQGGNDLGAPVQRFIRCLPLVRKPMIAAVDGLAVGIGTTLLFHCDLVYASPTASLRTPFLDLGLVPEAGSSLLAPLRMGYARAFALLVMGEPLTAERAREAGIVNAVVPADQLETVATDAARKLAAKPPEALALARSLMRGNPEAITRQIDLEIQAFSTRLTSPEAREAFAAFMEKRKPDFANLKR